MPGKRGGNSGPEPVKPRGRGYPTRPRPKPRSKPKPKAPVRVPIQRSEIVPTGPAGKVLGTLWGDVKQIGSGVAKAGYEYGSAAVKDLAELPADIAQRRNPLERVTDLAIRDIKGTAAFLDTAIPGDPVRIVKIHPSGKITFDLGLDDPGKDAKASLRLWREDPLIAAIGLLGVAGFVARKGAKQALARSIRQANPGMGVREAQRLAAIEVRAPGALAAQETPIAGGIPPRLLQVGDKTVQARPLSQSPLARGGQRLYDKASTRIDQRNPALPLSTTRRAARSFERNTLRKPTERFKTDIARFEREISLGTQQPSGLGRVIDKAAGRFLRGRDRRMKEALIASLEAPAWMTPRQAVETKIRDLTDELAAAVARDDQTAVLTLQSQLGNLRGALDGDRLESPRFTDALDALTEVSTIASEKYRAFVSDMPEADVLASQNQVAQRWLDKGLIPEGSDVNARGFYPHKEMGDLASESGNMTGFAGGLTVGVPRKSAYNLNKRELKRYEKGQVAVEPRVVSDLARARHKFETTEKGREFLYDIGEPLTVGQRIPDNVVAVRNPKAKPTRIPKAEQRALIDPDEYAENFDNLSFDSWLAERMYDPRKHGQAPVWMNDVDNVRLVPEKVVRTVLHDAFNAPGDSPVMALFSVLNAATRATLIYLPYGGARYIARNTPQNMILLALTRPKAFIQVRKGLAAARSNRALYDDIKVEAGTVSATAGLPELSLSRRTRAKRIERSTVKATKKIGGALGEVSDEPWRVASWLQYAREGGFKTNAQLRRLLDSDDPAVVRFRNDIAQRVRDDMLDFDALPPNAREILSRTFFIAPFIYASSKWPFVYLREYPVKSAILTLLAYQHQREPQGTPDNVQESQRFGDLDLGWLNPIGPAMEKGEAVQALLGEGNFRPLFEGLLPPLRETAELVKTGEVDPQALATMFLPGYTTLKKVQRGGGFSEQVLRMLGSTVDPPAYRKADRAESIQKFKDNWALVGASPLKYTMDQMATAENAYNRYKDDEARATFAAEDLGRDLTPKEKAIILTHVGRRYYPDANWPTDDQVLDAKSVEEYLKVSRELMFGPREYLQRKATEARNETEP